MTLYVDTSRDGLHGIGRYSREVVSRLDLEWTDLGHRLRKPLPVDAVNPRRMALSKRDVVYAPGFNAGITRATQLLTIHDLIHLQVPSEGSALKTLYYERIVKPAVRRAGMVFTVSETSKRYIAEWLADPSVEVVNTGNGVSEEFVSGGPRHRQALPYFVYVGNLREHKNVNVALDALARTADHELVMVTSERDEAERRIAERGLEDRVVVRADIEDRELASLYRGSVGLLMPSTMEGFGLPAAEAIACGVPVAFWQGCESVAEIVDGAGIGIETASDVDAWTDGLAAMSDWPREVDRPAHSGRPVGSWTAVAGVVQRSIRGRVER